MKTPPERLASIRSYYTCRATLQAQWALDLLDDFTELELSRDFIRGEMEAYQTEAAHLRAENTSAREVIEAYGEENNRGVHGHYNYDCSLARQWLEAHPKEEK